MGRMVDVDELVGTMEIAKRLRLTRHQLVHSWRRRYPDFPEPVAHLNRAMIWYWPDVEAWARKTDRLN